MKSKSYVWFAMGLTTAVLVVPRINFAQVTILENRPVAALERRAAEAAVPRQLEAPSYLKGDRDENCPTDLIGNGVEATNERACGIDADSNDDLEPHDRVSSIVAGLESELPPTERVIARSAKTFKTLGREVLRVKILDDSTGTIRELAIDMKDSAPVAYEQLMAQARSAWQQQHGAASPDLVERLSVGIESALSVDVEVTWLQDVDTVMRELKSYGLTVLSTHGRTITVRGRAEQIRTIISMVHVSSVAQHQERLNLAIGIARDLDQPSVAAAHSAGVGLGFLVALWEPGACIRRDHPDFANITWEPRFKSDCDISNFAGHSTSTAGILAADRGKFTAGLFRGRMFDVDSNDAQAVNDMWARSPQIVNASFTITRHDGRAIDRAVYESGVFVFNGAGNDSKDEANCYAFNALCVGGYLENGTTGDFKDDTLYGHSFLNDRYNEREYPQVLGPVHAEKTASAFRLYADFGGTSAATPGVAGLAALLLAHQPFALWQRPALMRAILMASAQAHPIVDGGRRIPDVTDNIDDRMGVGVPNGLRARSILDERTFLFKNISPATLGMQASFSVDANERVRVVLAWDQCPGYDIFDPELTADLDLAVKAPSKFRFPFPATVTYTNTSFSDNWEVVEFVAQATGTVDVIVSASRFEKCGAENNSQRAPMAIAWTKEPVIPVVKQVRGGSEFGFTHPGEYAYY